MSTITGCPNQDYKPDFTKLVESSQEAQKALISALEASGTLGCSYTNSQGQASFCAAKIPGIRVGCGQAGVNSKAVTGCASVNLMSNTINNMQTMIKCVLTNTQSSNEVKMVNNQRIEVELGNVRGSTIDLSQKNEVSVRMANIIDEGTQTAVANAAQNAISTAATSAQETANQAFSDEKAQVSLKQLSANLNNYANSQNIKNTVSTVASTLMSDQTIKIKAGDIVDSTVKISQENAINLVTEVFVTQIVKDAFSNTATTQAQTNLIETQSQKNTNAVMGDITAMSNTEAIGGSIIMVVLLVVGGVVMFYVIKAKMAKMGKSL